MLFSYVVARDYGFAPNPFFGVCTLATCKPRIRKAAKTGNWIIGTGSKQKQRNRQGFLVYVMRISETMTFNEYWSDERFRRKKPNLRGSKKQAFGDNIYFKDDDGDWQQQDSHHSYENGVLNPHNIKNDTQTDKVLIGEEFAYWGGSGPVIPQRFRDYNGIDICAGRNHKSRFPDELVAEFIEWFQSLKQTGYQGKPLDWTRTP
uniref:Nucleotide modification associated domain-containing protein n=1 Tax=Candidatus Kentrum sp. DK TaxID=2126562 RepID=A0A450T948_9GAMM|nr:MAG: hypothetical protein BECKDK2373C_GA0170839_110424 [Candidatus Kentron sp. DK]